MHLGIIFVQCCWILGAESGSKIKQTCIPKGIVKTMQKNNGPSFLKIVAALRYLARRGLGAGSPGARRWLERGPGTAGGRVGRGEMERKPPYVI